MFLKLLVILLSSLITIGCSAEKPSKPNPVKEIVKTDEENDVEIPPSIDTLWYKNFITDRMTTSRNLIEPILEEPSEHHDNDYIVQLTQVLSKLQSIMNELKNEKNIPLEYVDEHSKFLLGMENAITALEDLLRNKETSLVQLKRSYNTFLELLEKYNSQT